MRQAKELLDLDDEISLYLLTCGLKPAASLVISCTYSPLAERVKKNEEIKDGVRHVTMRLQSSLANELRTYLKRSGVAYKDSIHMTLSKPWDDELLNNMQQVCYDHHYHTGSNEANLERFVQAKSDREIGTALGFPKESVDAFDTVIDGERRDQTYVEVQTARAKQAGIELPTWLAYINFVPDRLNLVSGNVSSSAKETAEKHQAFVRENNPELAERIEKRFLNRRWPTRWEKEADCGYTCYYDLLK